MNKEERSEELSRVYSLYESNEEFQDAVEKLVASLQEPIEQIMEKLADVYGAFSETGKQLNEIFTSYSELYKNYEELQGMRPPVVIKKELKHEKNPMRIKQLNRELNESCLFYKRKNKIKI